MTTKKVTFGDLMDVVSEQRCLFRPEPDGWRYEDGEFRFLYPEKISRETPITVWYEFFHHGNRAIDTKQMCDMISSGDLEHFKPIFEWATYAENWDDCLYFPAMATVTMNDEEDTLLGDLLVITDERAFRLINVVDFEHG